MSLKLSSSTSLALSIPVSSTYAESDPKVISGKIAEKEFEILCTLNFDLTVELAFGMLPPIKHHFWHRLV